jgi:hypothetical protein
VLRITCPRCDGARLDCSLCLGVGFKLVHRCPNSHATEEVADAFAAYHLLESGVLPSAGAWSDQTEHFVRAVAVINSERSIIEGERQARQDLASKQRG